MPRWHDGAIQVGAVRETKLVVGDRQSLREDLPPVLEGDQLLSDAELQNHLTGTIISR